MKDGATVALIMVKNAAIIGVIILLGLGATAVGAAPLDSIRLEINSLRADIVKGEGELANLDSEIESTTKDIIHLYQRIDGQEQALVEQQEVLDSRIQNVYKNHDYLVLGVILNARNFNELWKGFFFLARLNRADQDLLSANRFRAEKIKELKEELAERKRSQLELKRRKKLDSIVTRRRYETKQAELQKKLAETRAWEAQMAQMKRRASGSNN